MAAASAAVDFTCRCAMLLPDATGQALHVALVPDEGLSAIAQLHDRLHTGPLAACLRLDIPYIPHITVATLHDGRTAQALCRQLNRDGVAITGQLDQLTVGELHAGRFVDLFSARLGTG